MKVAVVVTDILMFSRIDSAAAKAGQRPIRVETPDQIPPDADLVIVDWAAREPGWADVLRSIDGRIILFGPHTDLEAHRAARTAGVGPMIARSKLLSSLPQLMAGDQT